MSRRSDIQSITLLCVITSCFKQLHTFRYFGRLDMHRMCAQYYEEVVAMVMDWPGNTSDERVPEAVNSYFQKWEEVMGAEAEGLPATTIVFICSQVLADLQDKTRSRWKKLQLQKLDKPVRSLEAFLDPEGANFPCYDQGKRLLDILYGIVRWEF